MIRLCDSTRKLGEIKELFVFFSFNVNSFKAQCSPHQRTVQFFGKYFFLLGRVLIEGFRAKSAYIAFRADLYVCRTDLRNDMDKKTSGKCHASVTSSFSKTTVSFVFHSTKDLQEIPLAN